MKASGIRWEKEPRDDISTKIKTKAKKDATIKFPIIGIFLNIEEYSMSIGILVIIMNNEYVFNKNADNNDNTIIIIDAVIKNLVRLGFLTKTRLGGLMRSI